MFSQAVEEPNGPICPTLSQVVAQVISGETIGLQKPKRHFFGGGSEASPFTRRKSGLSGLDLCGRPIVGHRNPRRKGFARCFALSITIRGRTPSKGAPLIAFRPAGGPVRASKERARLGGFTTTTGAIFTAAFVFEGAITARDREELAWVRAYEKQGFLATLQMPFVAPTLATIVGLQGQAGSRLAETEDELGSDFDASRTFIAFGKDPIKVESLVVFDNQNRSITLLALHFLLFLATLSGRDAFGVDYALPDSFAIREGQKRSLRDRSQRIRGLV